MTILMLFKTILVVFVWMIIGVVLTFATALAIFIYNAMNDSKENDLNSK